MRRDVSARNVKLTYIRHENTVAITAADVSAARKRFDDPDVVQRTPVEYSRSLSDRTGGDVHLKMEHLQRTGSFKTCGAYNKLLDVTASGEVGEVVAASTGNHAQGVALAAARTGVPATIVMPTTAPQTKVDATRGYGAEVVLHGVTFGDAVEHARSLAVRVDELAEDVSNVETIVVPIDGGGLIGGIGAALAETRPDVRLVGVQADDAATVPDSLRKGCPVPTDDVDTIADGIATGHTGQLTFSLIEAHVDEVGTVSEEEIVETIEGEGYDVTRVN